jgi:hypothetical protein
VERERLRELEREFKELPRANAILKTKCVFAKELDQARLRRARS